jgi:hypothetical protein
MGAILRHRQQDRQAEDMRPGVDTAQRPCQGAVLNRASLGRRLPSAAVLPGVAVSQLPCPGFPLVLPARVTEPHSASPRASPSPSHNALLHRPTSPAKTTLHPPAKQPTSPLKVNGQNPIKGGGGYFFWEKCEKIFFQNQF